MSEASRPAAASVVTAGWPGLAAWARPRLDRVARWTRREAGDRDHALGVERVLAITRLALSVLLLVAVLVDPHQVTPASFAAALGFIVYSTLLVLASRRRSLVLVDLAPLIQAADLAWTVALVLIGSGIDSPYNVLFVYGILAAAYRWGLWVPLSTAGFAILFAVEAAHIRISATEEATHLHAVAIVLGQVALGTGLIGLLADQERRRRDRARALHRIVTRVGGEGGFVAAVQGLFEELLGAFGARRGALTLAERDGETVLLWTAERVDTRTDVRLSRETRADCARYLFDLPEAADVVRISLHPDRSGAAAVASIDGDGIPSDRQRVPAGALEGLPFAWQSALCAQCSTGEGWAGRLFVFDPRRGGDAQLRFLQSAVRQLAPALTNLYLRRRLQSRVGIVDRVRLAQQLHDGVIQSLVGIEMELHVLQREADAEAAGLSGRLVAMQHILRQEILNIRDLMQALRPEVIEPAEIVEHLSEMVAAFRQRTGIRARMRVNADRFDPPRRTCREVSGIVQEALSNIRKHSGASKALVCLLECTNGGWRLVIGDNGRGFDFEGDYGLDELDRRRCGPVVIKQRVRALGGGLVVRSRRGHGSRLDIAIPGGRA